jgi:hypothetical protein
LRVGSPALSSARIGAICGWIPFRRPSRIAENLEGEEETNPQMTQRNTDEETIEGVGRRPPALSSFICVDLCHLWIGFFFSWSSDGSWAP